MTEAFLHYVWQHQLFNSSILISDEGSKIEVLKPGTYNTSAGPDFFNAHLRIDGILWAGNVEIHINSSDWFRHNHQFDVAYDSCILHVVYSNDTPTARMNGSRIPTLEIRNLFPPYLWDNYLHLIGTQDWIACKNRIGEIQEDTWKKTFNEAIEERLNHRCNQILIALNGNKDDWQETFYQFLCRNFGFQLNALPFEMMARSLPLKIILKERKQLQSIESLLFGQAGMLQKKFTEDYPLLLQEEYGFLRKKYNLINIPFSNWKFLRLRPVNFPTIRLAQLAALLHKSPAIFSEIIEAEDLDSIISILSVTTSHYWDSHYQFENLSVLRSKKMGVDSMNNLLINTCLPFMYSWGKFSGDKTVSEKALEFLSQIPAEENHIISHWKNTGIKVKNAVESQSLLQLKTNYCSEKKCLTCRIGNTLINSTLENH